MAVMEGCEVVRRRNYMEEERAIQHAGKKQTRAFDYILHSITFYLLVVNRDCTSLAFLTY
jgi:hypothetical protein